MECEKKNENLDDCNNNIKHRDGKSRNDEHLGLVHPQGNNDQDIGRHITNTPDCSPDAVTYKITLFSHCLKTDYIKGKGDTRQ